MENFKCPRRNEVWHDSKIDNPKPDMWRINHTCSYCGSVDPDKILEMIKNGKKVTPTDKNYKIYIGDAGNKGYFQHFNEKHIEEFIKLYNDKTMKLEAPGYFYVMPFFMKPIKKDPTPKPN